MIKNQYIDFSLESAYLLICSIYCMGPGVGGSRLSMCVTALLGANLTQTIELFRLAVKIYWYLLFGISIHEIRIIYVYVVNRC